MRSLFIVLFTFIAASAAAETRPATNSAFVDVGYAKGGATFGAAYEYLYNGQQSVGGQIHFYPKDANRSASGYTIVGVVSGYHFYKGEWDFNLMPGFNIMNISSGRLGIKDETIVGPSISLSLVTVINPRLALGFDYANYFGWFSNNFRGQQVSDLDFKVKVNF